MNLDDVLQKFAELDQYDLPLALKVKYGINALVESGDYSCFEAFPSEVKKEILFWVQEYRSTGEWYLLSSTGKEDLSQLMAKLVTLLPIPYGIGEAVK